MHRVRRSLGYAIALPLIVSLGAGSVFGRQTSVTGSVGTGYDYRERSYDQPQSASEDDGDTQKIFIGPTITINSKGMRDTLDFSYSPRLGYDFADEDTEVDHNLSLVNQRFLTSRWSLTLADTFMYSDDPDQETGGSNTTVSTGGNGQVQGQSQDRLSRDISGRRYWTNTASLRTSYTLAEKSQVGGGYSYTVLRNDSDTDAAQGDSYDEYDKHSVFANITHGFSPNWRSSLGIDYTRGLYDQDQSGSGQGTAQNTPDLDQYGLSVGLDYVHSPTDFFPLKYVVSETQYDGDSRRDTQAHEWSLGWDHAFDVRTRMAIGGGPSYAKTEGLDGTWGYNAYALLTRLYQHASLMVQFDKRYETQNFTGTEDSGLTDTYNARINFTRQLSQALGMDLYGRYTWQSNIDPQGDYLAVADGTPQGGTGDVSYDSDEYEVGVGLRYAFGRWYTAGLKYSYFVSDGDLATDQYNDHQVMLTLSATKDLWQW